MHKENHNNFPTPKSHPFRIQTNPSTSANINHKYYQNPSINQNCPKSVNHKSNPNKYSVCRLPVIKLSQKIKILHSYASLLPARYV